MVMQGLEVVMTSKSVRLTSLETESKSVNVPHREMNFIMKILPLLEEIFLRVESRDKNLKLLMGRLLNAFVISLTTNHGFDPKSFLKNDPAPQHQRKSSLEKYLHHLTTLGYNSIETFEKYQNKVYEFCEILNLSREDMCDLHGYTFTRDLFRQGAYDFLDKFYREEHMSRELVHSQCFSIEFFPLINNNKK